MNEEKKAFIVTLFFFLLFIFAPLNWHFSGDFNFHYSKARGCENHPDKEACAAYYPLLHFIGQFFAFSPNVFAIYLIFLVAFVTPLILFLQTKKWVTVWLYFSTTQYFYSINGGAAYPQALAYIFLLGLFLTKNNWLRSLIFFVGILAHSQAVFLIGITWFVLYFFENFNFGNAMLACSSFFNSNTPDFLKETVKIPLLAKSGKTITEQILFKDILNFFLRMYPLPFLFFSLRQLWREKNFAPIFLCAFFFYYGFVSSQRVFFTIPLLLLPSLTRFYSTLTGWHKKGFIALTIVYFLFQIYFWAQFKITCL